ncbi:MAG: hypothetical protein B6244_05355 [Candidatus Cloacimonetes bacterium 4572_55]|nr:MAG: hypothetical protein B6244_05355 [Candidatus Cloacimonetes bacterium 4572_55]
MNKHTLKILEYEQLKSILSERAVSIGGKREISEMQPLFDVEQIRRKLDETTEFCRLLEEEGQFPFVGLQDIRGSLICARAPGSILDIQSLVQITGVCRGSRVAHNFIKKRGEKTPRLATLAKGLFNFNELESAIETTIDPSGDIMDNASPQLAKIRRSLHQKRDQIQQKLNAILQRMADTGRADLYITLREGRYVIPVRQDERGQTPGVVHDHSSSGATVFVEPFSVAPLNNDMRALFQEERKEIKRILLALTDMVRENQDRLTISFQTLTYLDMTGAKARLSLDFDCISPEIGEGLPLCITNGRHILLADIFRRQNKNKKEQGNTVSLPDDINTILVTGPNTGGKTVFLKTIGLIALSAQSGLHVPASHGVTLPIFTDIFADIGDEQSLQQSLSTFSSHMKQIIHFVYHASDTVLILLDELGAGTDPEEGAALSMAILEYLTANRATTIATTHYGVLKVFAHEHPHIMNGSMEFDRATLAPTYRFHPNLPGSSYALEISGRLGMPAHILETARALRRDEEQDISRLVADLENEHRKLTEERESLREEIDRQKKKTDKYEQKLEQLKSIRQTAKEKALKEAADFVKDTKKKMKQVVSDLKKEATDREKIQKAQEKAREKVRREEQKIADRQKQEGQTVPREIFAPLTQVQVGDQVRIADWDRDGVVAEAKDNKHIIVETGTIRIMVSLDRLTAIKNADEPKKKKSTAGQHIFESDTLQSELDIRGFRAEEAIQHVEKYLDDVYIASLEQVRIIHGKGTGVLRRVVSEILSRHPWVLEQNLAPWNQGGSGVTVVKLNLK